MTPKQAAEKREMVAFERGKLAGRQEILEALRGLLEIDETIDEAISHHEDVSHG